MALGAMSKYDGKESVVPLSHGRRMHRCHHIAVGVVGAWIALFFAAPVLAQVPNPVSGASDSTSPTTQLSANGVPELEDSSRSKSATPAAAADVAAPQENERLGSAPHAVEVESPRESLPLGGFVAPSETPSGAAQGSWILQTLGALGMVIAVALALRWFLQRMGAGQATGAGGTNVIEVLARTPVGHRSAVMLIRVGPRVLVVAQGPDGLRPLDAISDPSQVAAIIGEITAARPQSISQGFRRMLQGFDAEHASKEGAAVDDAVDPGDAEHAVDRTRHELAGLMGRIRDLKNRTGTGS